MYSVIVSSNFHLFPVYKRYYWFKRSHPLYTATEGPTCRFPIDIENLMCETLEMVRPKLVHFTDYSVACTAAEALEGEYR